TAIDSPQVRVRVAADLKTVKLRGENIKINGRWWDGTHALSFVRKSKRNLWMSDHVPVAHMAATDSLAITGTDMQVEDAPVPRSLRLFPRPVGRIDVLADLPLERYVEGVLAGEMPASWPMESLKAQAIAARSFFLALKRNAKHKNFDVDSSQFDQVFRA